MDARARRTGEHMKRINDPSPAPERLLWFGSLRPLDKFDSSRYNWPMMYQLTFQEFNVMTQIRQE
jgi:hypothetical protein